MTSSKHISHKTLVHLILTKNHLGCIFKVKKMSAKNIFFFGLFKKKRFIAF